MILKSKVKILRSVSNEGDLCKQRFLIVFDSEKKQKPALMLIRYTLTENKDDYIRNGHFLMRSFKDKHLMKMIYPITIDSFNEMLEWLYSISDYENNPQAPHPKAENKG